MAFAIFMLIGFSVLTLIFKSVWTSKNSLPEFHKLVSSNRTCKDEDILLEEACFRCSKPELKEEAPACMKTGYKQIVECKDGKKFWRSCEITPAMDEKKFWIFASVNLLIGIAAYAYVIRRQKTLDGILMEKINKQLSSGL